MSYTETRLICEQCGKSFNRLLTLHNANLKKGNKHVYCSHKCSSIHKSTCREIPCKACGTIIIRQLSKIQQTDNHFCSHRCSAKISNQNPNRLTKRTKVCATCPNKILSHMTYCKECWNKIKTNNISYKSLLRQKDVLNLDQERTLGDLETLNGKSSKYSYIRSHARAIIQNRPKICNKCGYSKYVECCHKKPVSSFSKETPIRIVNHPDNLVWLCPNCHVELDRNL